MINEHDRPLFKSSYNTTHSVYHNCTNLKPKRMSTFQIFCNWHKLDMKSSTMCKHAQMSINSLLLTLFYALIVRFNKGDVRNSTPPQKTKQSNRLLAKIITELFNKSAFFML